ncbi:peptidoglycan-binding protein [Streptomyces sp. NPDC102406]|uniref:peptidoglycan-binding protein n=1 Tax=Streptomyces sp. NPDC102406 TaxID=3366171 RepID=UPI00380F2169
MSGEVRTCPECGAAAGPDGGAACGCEAEGFGPLRVRPYVTLTEPSQPPPPRVPDPYAHPPLPPERRPSAGAGHDQGDGSPGDPPRRTPVLLLAAVAGVLSVAALVTVLISSGDDGTPTSTRGAAAPLSTASAPPRPTQGSSSPSGRASPPVSPSAPGSVSAAAPPAPTRTASPTRSAPSASASSSPSSASPTPSASQQHTRPPRETVLRRGDQGPEVAELQYRLHELSLYPDHPDGTFDGRTEYAVRAYQMNRGIQEDAPGTYGPATRRALEAQTRRGGDGWQR